jgi:alkanesulfonate monooxygenase SsuD/methylene tetrahydromethanopterin reductase-like flavin-dependent oxidoreductase (luciferase family)
MTSVKLGVHLPVAGPGASPEVIAQVAEEAERIGLDSVWSWERLMRPTVPIAMGGMTTVLSRAGGVDVSERLGCPFCTVA